MNGLWWEQCREIRLEVFANLQNYQDPNVLRIFTSENILFDEIKFFRPCLWWQTFLDITSMGNSWISFAWPKTMNNIILQQRVLMSVCKPSGSRKTILFFHCWLPRRFVPGSKKIFFLSRFSTSLKKSWAEDEYCQLSEFWNDKNASGLAAHFWRFLRRYLSRETLCKNCSFWSTEGSTVFLSNTTCSSKVDGRVQLNSILHIIFSSIHHAIVNKLKFPENN